MNVQPSSVTDRVLTDSLAIPPGVDTWLRAIERKARSLREALRQNDSHVATIEIVPGVLRKIDAFLEDEHASPLHRLLRRPLSQLAPGTPASRSFDRYSSSLFREAEQVLETREAVWGLFDDWRRLLREHGERMPYFTHVLLESTGLTEEVFLRVRSPLDARMLHRRMRNAESRLVRLARHLPPRENVERSTRLGDEGVVTISELWATLQLRLRQRTRAKRDASRTEGLRHLQAREVRALGRAGQWSRPAAVPAQAMAEYVADQSLAARDRTTAGWEDGALWVALLCAAEGARFDPPVRGAWQPRTSTPAQAQEPADDTTVYAVHLANGFVFLSTTTPSPVRVWSRAIREGETVDCRVFGDPGSAVPLEWVGSDIAPLFEGSDPREPAWYSTEHHAILDVLFAYQGGWFARVRTRGAVRRQSTPAWQSGENTSTSVRALISSRSSRKSEVVRVGETDTAPRMFLGLQTREVLTPYVHCRVAWLRVAEGSSPSRLEALEREGELFRALRMREPHLAPTALGRGQREDDSRVGLLYAPPFGGVPAASPLLTQWMREQPASFLGAAIRVLLCAHEAGYALGVAHLDMFAFGLEPEGPGPHFQPRATLLTAPAATRFGRPYPSDLIAHRMRAPEYPRLGFRGVSPAVQYGETALPNIDVIGFALMALEIMCRLPPDPHKAIVRWRDLPVHIERNADSFANADLAGQIAQALSTTEPTFSLLSALDRACRTNRAGK